MAQAGGKARRRKRALARAGIALLVAMNRLQAVVVHPNWRAKHACRGPTIYRLLQTLEYAGYVTRSCPPDRYCLVAQGAQPERRVPEDEWISRSPGR